VCGALTILGAAGVARLELETDLRHLRPSDHPTVRAEAALVRDFGLGIDTSTVTVRVPAWTTRSIAPMPWRRSRASSFRAPKSQARRIGWSRASASRRALRR
jgi:hypothetical protein